MKKVLVFTAAVSPLSAFAALPAGVQTAITSATADGTELGYALLVMAVIVGTVFWLKRKGG